MYVRIYLNGVWCSLQLIQLQPVIKIALDTNNLNIYFTTCIYKVTEGRKIADSQCLTSSIN